MPLHEDLRPLPGEPVALDLVNTRYRDRTGHIDLINTRAALNRWLHTSGHLKDYPDPYQFADDYAFTVICRARDILTQFLADAADPNALARFNTLLSHGRMRHELTPTGPVQHLDIDDPAHLIGYLAAVSYLTLLTRDLDRLRTCANDCGLYFFDTSRNGSRRWCSREGCGNRVRVARHYARRRNSA
ncbi:CGNR zinc finger domain-containing protein [Streptomyces violascens]|uniref:CGNR zinc finger domain-containing protein n=1 Tax=Streptomyces violascens TaxID=67381 RepID=UPI0016753E4E|nr:CGNR zinc finger domain-containing protein [Streptomyces violascens]GGU47661.1 hypothetical protein GCM10010289_80300 [Streptomyces violascens]